eukprot:CAMPEP_0182905710 /NCGR_PEP_ID=MMETSP0034_2-20130328/33158_1 /TAXON_ID=156128 /ORGANISM="Nephroselmis pyriformis, Strain CCMP717" /LENGTH=80 /DNA_ID=CAMNT_0025041189 /DNA_START=230 /DNA_END=469 /DNA_ORIENTATION=-
MMQRSGLQEPGGQVLGGQYHPLRSPVAPRPPFSLPSVLSSSRDSSPPRPCPRADDLPCAGGGCQRPGAACSTRQGRAVTM